MADIQRADNQIASNSKEAGFYSILSSYTLRAKRKFNVAVSVHKANESCEIKISLKGPSYEESKITKVEPMTIENVEFDIPAINEGDYLLISEGLQGIIFNKHIPLKFQDYDPVVCIQMDKSTYKPGDLIQFRVIFMDENTRPVTMDKPIDITIVDDKQNRLKQWRNIELKKGVYVGKYQLSTEPILGDWQIHVIVEGETLETKYFEVEKYVLPKFSVSVETIKDVAIYNGIVTATVRANYTYGKGVKGKAIVSIKPKNYYDSDDESKAEKTINVNGKGEVQFKIGDDFKVNSDYNTTVEIFAIVEEELTGNKMEGSAFVELHPDRFCFQGIDNPYEFHPGKPITLKVAVKTFDNMPVLNSKHPLKIIIEKVRHYYGVDESQRSSEENNVLAELISPLDESGIATFEYTFPEGDKEYYYLKCQYEECESHFTTLSKYREPDPRDEPLEPLTLTVLTESPMLGKNIEIEVKSIESIPYFIYTIHARGIHLKTELVTLPKDTTRYVLNVTPTFEMIPCASVFVHYIVGDNLKYEGTTISFNNEFDNFIDITAPTETNPGEEVPIEIKSNAESYVGLLGVDQSVLLLKSGNDLNIDDIFSKLERFDNSTAWRSKEARCPGENSGLVTLTNAIYPNYEIPICVMRSPGFPLLYRSSPKYSVLDSMELCEDDEMRTYCEKSLIPKIRKEFPESWLFEDLESINSKSVVIRRAIPDTITSWIITGFSINSETGLAISKVPATIKTFRPFFIGTNLPYSVRRGEQVTIPVLVFNYMDQDLQVEITLDNTDNEYEFIESDSDPKRLTKSVEVSASASESVNFIICPVRIGKIMLKISSVSPLAGDTIHKELNVEPEGIRVFKNRDYFLQTETGVVDVTNTLDLDIPENVVPDSEFIEVTVMGNILSSTITNIDNLVRMPCGCGEQIMVNFVPNILILRYLKSIQELTPTIEQKAKRFLEIGYQSELTYSHDDGSYSAFGMSDTFGSTWLTAYVIRCFHQAKNYIDIDTKILEKGLKFLSKTQASNGSFPEVGHLFDSTHMNEVGLTAFVLLTFLENKESLSQYEKTIERGFDFLQENVKKTDDIYALAVALYALQQRNHNIVKELLGKMMTLVQSDGDLKYWTSNKKENLDSNRYWNMYSHDVEITGYILMTLLDLNIPALPIIRWLIAQRNSNGGYGSTQDTVVGLWALIKFAEKTGTSETDMSVAISTPSQMNPTVIKVNKDNAMIIQGIELEKNTRQITYDGKGIGTSVLQISYRYNIMEKDNKPSFKLSVKMKPSFSPKFMCMDVLTEFTPGDHMESKTSNMAVMEVALPSGYTAVSESFDKISEVENVKRVESKDDGTSIVVYFDNLKILEEKSIPIQAELAHIVDGQKPVPVVVYDYYDNQKRAIEFYQIKSSLMES